MIARAHEFWLGLFSQIHVLHALLLREIRTRFGRFALGYLWAFLEPLSVIATFWALFTIANRKVPADMDPVGFLVTGMLPYHMFRNTVSRCMGAIQANKGLLYYPQVRPIDLMVARGILEGATYTLVFVVLSFANCVVTDTFPLDNALAVVGGLALTMMLGLAIGITFAAIAVFVPAFANLVGPVLRPMLWISGVFFTAREIPLSIRREMLFNPVLHLTELIRDGWYHSFDSSYWNLYYVGAWILGFLALGLVLERSARGKIEG